MSSIQKKWLYVTDVDTAREEVLECLPRMGKINYVDGWYGFGASAILRSIAEVLPYRKTTPELCFDSVIFIDCSNWKNRRMMQRTIAEELELDRSLMSILDEHDEDDDYSRVDESSRNEVDSVGKVIDQTLRDIKFMMIFLNGSDGYIDVGLLGIPPFARFGHNMMIWTFNRSLTMRQDYHEVVNKLRYTHGFINSCFYIKRLKRYQIWELLHQEAASIVARIPCMLDFNQKMVENCCLYELFLKHNFHITSKLDWATHGSSYWICDGIITRGHSKR
ncbi:unnamed protein product [Triticum turgidum subsp. durum]|uniref:Uncharacterized protein n=1 Tax=Triticum turgidum subsp. durum TaxID=4567 RepID=A0A9R1Q4N0_TRITD|nr:unnamed protein product [Triticum turgidum subsp. durum]